MAVKDGEGTKIRSQKLPNVTFETQKAAPRRGNTMAVKDGEGTKKQPKTA